MTLRILATVLVLLVTTLIPGVLSPAMGQKSLPPETSRTKPLNVVATTGMVADAARMVGQDHVKVTALMGPGVDPHLYKASPGDLRTLSDADIILYGGLHLEGKLADVLVRMARQRPVYAVTETIDPKLLREPPEFAGMTDPHVWFDVSLWTNVVEFTRDTLVRHDPGHKEAFERNADAYLTELRTLHEWCREQMEMIPKAQRVLVTAHDAFGYFGRAYGVDVLSIQGLSTESEASLREINRLVDTIVARKVKAVFVESSVPRKTIESLVEGCKARGHEVKIGGELFSDAMGNPGTPEGTYVGMVKHNVNTIRAALLGEGANAPDIGPKGPPPPIVPLVPPPMRDPKPVPSAPK
jgi:manganese/zinc/iron transport system substrate-binding protein